MKKNNGIKLGFFCLILLATITFAQPYFSSNRNENNNTSTLSLQKTINSDEYYEGENFGTGYIGDDRQGDISQLGVTEYTLDDCDFSDAPSNYDLREDIHIQVENQYSFGACVAFSSLTALETHLALKYDEYYEFSAAHYSVVTAIEFSRCQTENCFISGGNFYQTFHFLNSGYGPVLEEDFPYQEYRQLFLNDPNYTTDKTQTAKRTLALQNTGRKAAAYYNSNKNNFMPLVQAASIIDFPTFVGVNKLERYSTLPSYRNAFKNHIMTNGGLVCSIHGGTSDYYINDNGDGTTDTTLYCDREGIGTGHSVTIIGWDDNYPKENFRDTSTGDVPDNNGAYIVQNSWGLDWGCSDDRGIFYVSYDDVYIENFLFGFTSTDDQTEESDNIVSNYDSLNSASGCSFLDVINKTQNYMAMIVDRGENVDEQYLSAIELPWLKASVIDIYALCFNDTDTLTLEEALSKFDSITTSDLVADNYSIDPCCHFAQDPYDISKVGFQKVRLNTPIKTSCRYVAILIDVSSGDYQFLFKTTEELAVTNTTFISSAATISDFSSNYETTPTTVINSITYNAFMPIRICFTDAEHIRIEGFRSKNIFSSGSSFLLDISSYEKSPTDTYSISITTPLSLGTVRNIYNRCLVEFILSSDESLESLLITLPETLPECFYIISIQCNDTQKAYTAFRVDNTVPKNNVTNSSTQIFYHNISSNTTNTNLTTFTNSQNTISLSEPTRLGFTFIGWFTNSKLTGVAISSCDLNYGTSPHFYAKWDCNLTADINSTSNTNIITYGQGRISLSVAESFSENVNYSYLWFKDESEYSTMSTILLTEANQTGVYYARVSALFDGEIISVETGTINIIVNKVNGIITANVTQVFTYDGNQKYALANINNTEQSLMYSEVPTNAGTYAITIFCSESENYLTSNSIDVSLIIEKASGIITAEESQTYNYDGLIKGVNVNVNNSEQIIIYSNNQIINAGEYTISAYCAESDNYLLTNTLNITLIIEKAESIITADEIQSVTYNGMQKFVSANINNSEQSLIYSIAPISAGEYTISIHCPQSTNYKASEEKNITLNILKADSMVTADAYQEALFDGTRKTVVANINNDEQQLCFSNTPCAPGQYDIIVYCKESKNYKTSNYIVVKLTVLAKTLSMTKADSNGECELLIEFSEYVNPNISVSYTEINNNNLYTNCLNQIDKLTKNIKISKIISITATSDVDSIPINNEIIKILIPENLRDKECQVYSISESGAVSLVDSKVVGNYLVYKIADDATMFAVTYINDDKIINTLIIGLPILFICYIILLSIAFAKLKKLKRLYYLYINFNDSFINL